jgi:mono/diheme cytochrome c family protein
MTLTTQRDRAFACWLAAVALGFLAAATRADAQAVGGDRTVWSGVYTTGQADRGKARFETTCIRCHNIELTGSERGPALKGQSFWSKWENDSLSSLFVKIRDTMPQDGAGVVSDEAKVDILAYLLQRSDRPAGSSELKLEMPALEGIKIAKQSIWDGVYSTAQAERGKAAFLAGRCGGCHLVDLSGDRGPALKGEAFVSHWEGTTVSSLFAKIRDTMPPNAPNETTADAKIDIVAYLLASNGFPSGASTLKIDAPALDAIEVVRKGQGSRAPNFALVQALGCLSHGPGGAWVLTKTTEPVVTKQEEATPTSLKEAQGTAAGDLTFQLVSIVPFKPESHEGQRMEARGLIYRDATDARLNLTSLQMIGATCPN